MVENIDIRCRNCGKETGLSVKNMNKNYKDTINKFVLNIVLHHVGMLWIVKTNQQLEYGIDKNNKDRITYGTWYNTSICKKLHGTVFGKYTRTTRTDKCNIMCSIDAHEKQQPSSVDDGRSGGGNALSSN